MSVYSDKILSYGVWGYWPLNDLSGATLADVGPNNYTLTLDGTAPTTGVVGGVTDPTYTENTAITVSGASQYYNNTNPSSIRSIIVWFKTGTTPGSGNHMPLFTTWWNGNANSYFGMTINAVGFLVGKFLHDNTNNYYVVSPSLVTDDQWHMAALTYDSSASLMSMYLDGELIDTIYAPDANSLANRVRFLYAEFDTLPAGGGSGFKYYTGSVDEVAALTTTLTGADVADIYDIGVAQFDRVNTSGDFTGTVVVNPADNDNFEDARVTVIPYGTTSYRGPAVDSAGATTEALEPSNAYSNLKSAWWSYTPATSGTAVFDTIGSYRSSDPAYGTADTQISVYTGTGYGNLTTVGWDSDSGGAYGGKTFTSRLSVPVVGGTTYWVQVGSWTNSEILTYVLNIEGPSTQPEAPNTPGNFDISGDFSSVDLVVVTSGEIQIGENSIDTTGDFSAPTVEYVTQEAVKAFIKPGAPAIRSTQETVKALTRPGPPSIRSTQEAVKTLVRVVPIATEASVSGYVTAGATVTGNLSVQARQRESQTHAKVATYPDPTPPKLSEEHAKTAYVPDPMPSKASQSHVKVVTERGTDNPPRLSQEHAKTATVGISSYTNSSEHIKVATSNTEPAVGRVTNEHIKIADNMQPEQLLNAQTHTKMAWVPEVDPHLTNEHLKVASTIEAYPVQLYAESLLVAFTSVAAHEIDQAHVKVLSHIESVDVVGQAHVKTAGAIDPDTRNTAAHTKVAAVILSVDQTSATHTKVAVEGLDTSKSRKRGWGVLL